MKFKKAHNWRSEQGNFIYSSTSLTFVEFAFVLKSFWQKQNSGKKT
jgi:hypothetical protein